MIPVQRFFQDNRSFGPGVLQPNTPGWRDAAASPRATVLPQNFHRRLPVLSSRRMGQASSTQEKALFYGAGLVNLAFLAATMWVGFTVGSQKKGPLRVAGYVTAIGAALASLYSLGIMGVETVRRPQETVLVPSPASQQ